MVVGVFLFNSTFILAVGGDIIDHSVFFIVVTAMSILLSRSGLLLILLLLSASGAQAERRAVTAGVQGWSVVNGNGSCQLKSAVAPISDGYLEIDVQLRFEARGLRVITPSTIDTEGDHLALEVDGDAVNVSASVEGGTDVLFSGDIDAIGKRFVRGGEADVRLRFWPTWPVTGTKTVRYNLRGFTAAWKQYLQCR